MVEVFIDDKSCELDIDSAGNVGEAIDAVSRQLEGMRRCMLELELDGTEVGPAEISSFFQKPVGEFCRLDIKTAAITTLVLQLIDELSGYISNLSECIVGVAAALKTDDPSEGLEGLGQVAEAWIEILERIMSAFQMLGLDPAETIIEGQSAAKRHEELSATLNAVCKLAEDQDFYALSEILEHDLAPHIAGEAELIEYLRDACEKLDSDSA
ncbi:hypothetical protein ACFL1X_05675 [Candidatus Hydrogenedentota bacterium]